MKYEHFEHTSDIGLIIYGHSLNELFENAGRALLDQITDLTGISPVEYVKISLSGETISDLLIAWMRELLYLFNSDHYLFCNFTVSISEADCIMLEAVMSGERHNPEIHFTGVEIKGVTYHNTEVKLENNIWKARVLLDV